MKEKLGVKNTKRGITIITLVIMIIILALLMGAIMLITNNDNIFGHTQSTVDEHNKQAAIETIQMKIRQERLEKRSNGDNRFTIKGDVIPILETYGTYEKGTMKLTTNDSDIAIYLYEILDLKIEEFITVGYKDDVLTVTENDESLSSNGYKYEYTYDNGVTWQTYTNPTTIEEQSGIKVRVLNSENEIISNEYRVTNATEGGAANSIEEIVITQEPTKVTYKQGERFDPTGIIITVIYDDNTVKTITDYTYTPAGALKVSDKYVTISYTENGATNQIIQPITVTNNPTAIGITELKKTSYKQGERINKDDIAVTVVYEDGTSKQVTNFTYSPMGDLQSTDTKLTVSYTEYGITRTTSKDIAVTYATELEVTSAPNKTAYIKGENFNTAGMTVTVKYADGTSQPVSNYTVIGGNNLQVGTTGILIEYTEGGITTNVIQPITVTNNATGIVVTKAPTKTIYNHGDTFDKTGMVVVATFQDNTTKQLEESEYTVSTPVYGQTTVTITYTEGGVTTTTPVVVKRVLSSIAVTTAPTKTIYNHADTFNKAGMVVKATYADGGVGEIRDYTITNGNLIYGQTGVTITYTENGATKTTTQPITVKRVLVSIAVTTAPTKTTYNHQQAFDKTGMVVKGTFTHTTTPIEVTGYTVSTPTYGQSIVTITYTENGTTATTTQAVTVKRVLSSIAVTTKPTTTRYAPGATFNKAGMVVKATYTDSSTAVTITSYTVTNPTITSGQSSVTISYTENGTTKTTTQAICSHSCNNDCSSRKSYYCGHSCGGKCSSRQVHDCRHTCNHNSCYSGKWTYNCSHSCGISCLLGCKHTCSKSSCYDYSEYYNCSHSCGASCYTTSYYCGHSSSCNSCSSRTVYYCGHSCSLD